MLPKTVRSAVACIVTFPMRIVASTLLTSLLLSPLALQAETPSAAYPVNGTGVVPTRLTSQIVESSRVTLAGNVHPLATRANDRGQLADSMKLERMQVVLKRSEAQEAGLKRLLTDMHSPGSASYHKWLTPETFGTRFGPSDADVATLETWLQSKGFVITKLAPGRQVLEISGTAGQLRNTFHTEMHQYAISGTTRYANATAPEIPAALAPVFGGFVSLNNFRFQHDAKILGKAQLNAATHEAQPDWTRGNSSAISLVLAPADFAVQYNLGPVYTAGTRGDGQTIAIVNESNINIALVNSYRSLFGLPVNPPQVIIDGNDPGVDGINSPLGPNGASGEAYLDVELSGAVAPNAQIDLVIANDTAVANGLTLAMEHAVYSNIAPVISLSFGNCEENRGTLNGFVESLWEQAAAQGQTVLVSTGDNGSAGCDFDPQYAVHGQAVNSLASTPFNVAVGGTDFYYSGGAATVGTYWNTTPTNSTPTVSLKSPAPEQPWNNSQYGLNLIPFDSSGATSTIVAASGGPSTLGKVGGTTQSPTFGPYPKPSWQTGAGVPADGARDLPDLSLFAANGFNASFYPICADDADCQSVASGQTVQITGIGGTSASTPAFAGMMALINQKYGRQGQANYILYPLAAQFPATFHDVTAGTIAVPCATTTVVDSQTNQAIAPKDCKTVSGGFNVTDSRYGQTIEGELSVDGTNAAYDATAGYDLATGLGTVDASNLVTNWGKITLAATTTTLIPSTTTFAHGATVGFNGTVTGSGTPTGDVALVTTSTDVNNQGETFFTLNGGSYTGSVSYLPGGSYNVSGYYAGDGVNGPSSSTPVAVTVTPEASATSLYVYSALNPATQVSTSTPVSYGAPNILSAIAAPSTGTAATTAPTGSVVFLDGSTTVNTAVVNVNGDAQYNGTFAVGSHTITAKYSGDQSYGASNSSPVSFSVAKNDPNIFVFESNQDSTGDPINGQTTYLAVQIENSASANGLALAPTGTVTVTGLPPGTNSSTTLVTGVDPYNRSPQGTGYFAVPATASGNFTVSFVYSGDSNYTGFTTMATPFTFVNGAGSVATTTTATASASSTSPTNLVTVATTVTGAGNSAPTGEIGLYASQTLLASRTLVAASGNSSTASVTFDSASLPQGTNQITVQYFPSTGSSFKISAAEVTIANPLSDFSIIPVATLLSVPATGIGAGFQTDVINLTSINGFSGPVSFTCVGASGVACSLTPASATLTSGGTASTTLLVDTGTITTPGSYNVTVTGKNAAGTVIHTLGLTAVTQQTAAIPRFTLTATGVAIATPGSSGTSTVVITPQNGFTGTVNLTCTIIGTASGPSPAVPNPTCAATSASVPGASAVTTTITINTDASTPAGTYTAFIKGDSGSLESIAPFALTVGPAGTAGFTLSGTAVSIASQGASGTSTITVTPTNSFTGTVSLTCSVTSAPSGAITANNPTCSAASASVTGTSTATATLTINTTAQTAKLDVPFSIEHGRGIFTAGGGATLAAILLFGIPFGSRRRQQLRSLRGLRMLSLAALFILAAGAVIGCGSGGSSGSTPPPPSGGTTLGSYTLTVTGTSGTATATTTIVVTVN